MKWLGDLKGEKRNFEKRFSNRWLINSFQVLLWGMSLILLSSCSQDFEKDISHEFSYDLKFVFIIFFVTLGPFKTIPLFLKASKDLDQKELRFLALRGVLIASILVIIISLVLSYIVVNWKISKEALMITGGILLFIPASRLVLNFKLVKEEPLLIEKKIHTIDRDTENLATKALSPVAVPTIVTPIGVVAILYFISKSSNWTEVFIILGILILTMLMNLSSMINSRRIMGFIGATYFQVIGWLFAVLQSALAVQMIYDAYKIIVKS